MISPFHHLPDRALLRTQEEQVPLSSSQLAARRFRDNSWELAETTHGLDVSITAQETPLKELVLRWDLDFPQGCRFLGGPWERGYGSQEWRGFAPDRVMAWYFAADNGQEVLCFGVKAQPHALCWWSADPHGFSLHLDLRCSGSSRSSAPRRSCRTTPCTALTTGTMPMGTARIRIFCRTRTTWPP